MVYKALQARHQQSLGPLTTTDFTELSKPHREHLMCISSSLAVVTALVRGAQFHPEKPQLAGPAVKAAQFQPEKPQLAVPAVKVAPRASLLLAASLKLARNKSGTEQTTRRGRLGIGQAIYGCIGASVKLVLLRH